MADILEKLSQKHASKDAEESDEELNEEGEEAKSVKEEVIEYMKGVEFQNMLAQKIEGVISRRADEIEDRIGKVEEAIKIAADGMKKFSEEVDARIKIPTDEVNGLRDTVKKQSDMMLQIIVALDKEVDKLKEKVQFKGKKRVPVEIKSDAPSPPRAKTSARGKAPPKAISS